MNHELPKLLQTERWLYIDLGTMYFEFDDELESRAAKTIIDRALVINSFGHEVLSLNI